MAEVIALKRFAHNGTRRRGDVFEASAQIAKELEAKGLVRIERDDDSVPPPAAGANVSASPAGQASPQTISTLSKRGGGRPKKKTAAE